MTYPNYELIEYIAKEKAKALHPELYYSNYCYKRSCRIRMDTFWQIWSSTALGFNANGCCAGQAMTPAYTTVVEMSWYEINNDNNKQLDENTLYAVFFGNEIAYMYLNPNDEFHHDLEHKCMKSQRESVKYLGEDDYPQCLNEGD